MSRSPSPQRGIVRNIISLFENQSHVSSAVRRSKSLGSLVQRPQVAKKTAKKPTSEVDGGGRDLELLQVGQEVEHLKRTLNNYRSYVRENHIYYQNQIMFLLTDLANVEIRNSARSIQQKSELAEDLKRLAKKLNGLLPDGDRAAVTPTRTEEKRTVLQAIAQKISENIPNGIGEENSLEETREEGEEEEEEEKAQEEVSISVKSLKQIFDAKSNQREAARTFGQAKLLKKSLTFSGTSALKYIPYLRQKYNDKKKVISEAANLFDQIVENTEQKEENSAPDPPSEDDASNADPESEENDSEDDIDY